MTQIAIFTAIIAIGAFIRIPSPFAGYFTMQLPFIIIGSLILGSKRAVLAVCLYIIGGLIGIPWFAGGGGIVYVLRPTFGFLLSFIGCAFLMGMYKKDSKLWIPILFAIISVIFVWVVGMVYYILLTKTLAADISFKLVFASILVPDFYVDLALAVLFAVVGIKVRKRMEGII